MIIKCVFSEIARYTAEKRGSGFWGGTTYEWLGSSLGAVQRALEMYLHFF